MNSNMAIWDTVSQTNPRNTKKVKVGSREFTAIDAYSQIKKATEMWGPMGKGWGFHADLEFGSQVVVANGTLWYGGDPETTVQAFGAARLANSKGVDPDAAKKAYTDALTKALSFLGFNADVFLGRFDDNRYVAEMNALFNTTGPAPNQADAWNPNVAPGHLEPKPQYQQQPAPQPVPQYQQQPAPQSQPAPLFPAPNQAGGCEEAGQALAVLRQIINQRGIPSEVIETMLGYLGAGRIEDLKPNQLQIAIRRFSSYPPQKQAA